MGFDVSAQNIFSAQPNLQSKMNSILQRISKMAAISCSSGQIPSVQVGILAMDSASEPVQLEFTDNADELFEAFRALRSRGPFVLNGRTISAYTNRFKGRQNNAIKVGYLISANSFKCFCECYITVFYKMVLLYRMVLLWCFGYGCTDLL